MSQQRVALVTGASSGMGKVIAQQLLADGLTVIAAARRVAQMQDLQAQGAHAIAVDVSQPESIAAMVEQITTSFGGVDILVNNAGFGLYGAVEDIPLEDARYQFEVNLFGAAQLIREVLPHMRAQRSGKIINITSMGGKIYTPMGAWYHASKHALEGLSDCLRLEVARFGIDVVVVEPGIIRTGFGDVLLDPLKKYSGAGAYSDMVEGLVRATETSYAEGAGSPPQVIADVVSRAIKSPRPRTRYAAGQYAGLMIAIRKWFGDRFFDRVILSRMG